VGGGWRLAFVPALLACHGAAFVCLQLGFQRGSALATGGVATLLTNAGSIAGGILLFHEHLPGGALGVARVLAFAAVVAGAAALAKPEREALPTSAVARAAPPGSGRARVPARSSMPAAARSSPAASNRNGAALGTTWSGSSRS